MTARKRIIIGLATTIALAACSSHNESPQAPPPASGAATARSGTSASAPAPVSAASESAVRTVVERFGRNMQNVSVLAPAPAIRDELPRVYGNVLAPALLRRWQDHTDEALGREGSSPWPARIEIGHIACHTADACRVTGHVDYITSNELEHGGVFMRRAITLEAGRTSAGWRITAAHLAPARQ